MNRRIKEIIEVPDHLSLDDLIARLIEIRARLPEGAETQMRMRGDDVFGRHFTISYFRDDGFGEARAA